MVENKVECSTPRKVGVTVVERDILSLLSDEHLTIPQVAIRRQTSKQAVYKILSSLKKKGLINKNFQRVEKNLSTMVENGWIRLHGQEFNIKIIYKDKRYKELKKRANVIDVDGNTVRLYRDSVEVYSVHSFFSESVQKATAKSFRYWSKFFRVLENDLKIILVKSRVQNIKQVNAHYSETNNELAQDCIMNHDKIRVYTREDGKLWFLIDNSFNLCEAETVHSHTAYKDMQGVIRPFFNDLRGLRIPFRPSQVLERLDGFDPIGFCEAHIKHLSDVFKHEGKIRSMPFSWRIQVTDWLFQRFGGKQ